jgi:threonine/homoserine/homoserine lactone efflux protein
MGLAPGPAVTSIGGYALSSGRAIALASVAGMAVGNLIAMSLSLSAYRIQALILVATFVLVVALTDTLYALAASGAARLLRRPSAARWISCQPREAIEAEHVRNCGCFLS